MTGLVRQLKLHGVVRGKDISDPRIARIVSLFEQLFDGLQVSIIPEYSKNVIIFHKGSRFYMISDECNAWLLCRRDKLWDFLVNEIGLGYSETQMVITTMVRKHIPTKRSVKGGSVVYDRPLKGMTLSDAYSKGITIDSDLCPHVMEHLSVRCRSGGVSTDEHDIELYYAVEKYLS